MFYPQLPRYSAPIMKPHATDAYYAACHTRLAMLLALGLGGCALTPDTQPSQALTHARAFAQAQTIAAVQTQSDAFSKHWDQADWADLASHALAVNLQWKVTEIGQWLAQANAQQALSQTLPAWAASRVVVKRNVDEAQTSGTNAGTTRALTSREWSWDMAGSGGLWLRAQAAGQRSAQSDLAMQAAVQQILFSLDLALSQAQAMQTAQTQVDAALKAIDQALALTTRLMPLGLQDPLQIAAWQDGLTELRRLLMVERDQAAMARERLASLLQLSSPENLPGSLPAPARPAPDILLRLPAATWTSQAQLALQQRRELREADIELEALRLEQLGAWFLGLPTLKLQRSDEGDSSATLVNNRWKEKGDTGGISLIGLINAWHQHRVLGQTRERERLRQQLLAFSVIEQLRLARLELASALERASMAARTLSIRQQQRDLRLARTPFQDSDDIEQARAIALHALAAAAQARADTEVQRAWQQWQLSIGLDLSNGIEGSSSAPTDLQPATLRQRWKTMVETLAS
jgi:hypothetical protein